MQITDTAPRNNFLIILILGALSTVTPFAIDMYLPAFPQLAVALGSTPPQISLSVSSYFVGFALGQVMYGPLLDRFGRKRPLYAGLSLFVIASLGCLFSKNVEMLIGFRFLQALGGCVASTSSMAMVRDFFPGKESTKVFSLLVLILGVSPLLAPTFGSIVAVHLGWQWVFIFLAGIVTVILLVAMFFLPEGHKPDRTISLAPLPILKTFWHIFKTPQFYTYALANAFSFAGLLVYVAGSPILFMEVFKLSPQMYGAVFAMLSVGFIGGSQVNLLLLKKFSSEQIFPFALKLQSVFGVVFLGLTAFGLLGLWGTVIMLFLCLSCLGIAGPNGNAMALAPFAKNAGSAAALSGFLQIGLSSVASASIGALNANAALPIVVAIVGSTWIGLGVYVWGKRHIPSNASALEDKI